MPEISISDLNLFLRCRRAWAYQSPLRRGLRKVGAVLPPLSIGSAVHVGLAAQARGEDPYEAIGAWYADEVFAITQRYIARVGVGTSPLELQPIDEAYHHALNLTSRYFQHYGQEAPLGANWRYVAVEQTFRVPIPGTAGEGCLIGTIDGIVRHTATNVVAFTDIKTYERRPDFARLAVETQFTAYAWALRQLFPYELANAPSVTFLYDGISRKLPVAPTLLKSGKLSQQFTDSIDYQTYRHAITAHGLDATDYQDILGRLAERDAGEQNPFFTRWQFDLSKAQTDAFASYLPAIYYDMQRPAIYPHFSWASCFGCQVTDLCHAEQRGEDVEWLIKSGYTTGGGSPSHTAKRGEEVTADVFAA